MKIIQSTKKIQIESVNGQWAWTPGLLPCFNTALIHD